MQQRRCKQQPQIEKAQVEDSACAQCFPEIFVWVSFRKISVNCFCFRWYIPEKFSFQTGRFSPPWCSGRFATPCLKSRPVFGLPRPLPGRPRVLPSILLCPSLRLPQPLLQTVSFLVPVDTLCRPEFGLRSHYHCLKSAVGSYPVPISWAPFSLESSSDLFPDFILSFFTKKTYIFPLSERGLSRVLYQICPTFAPFTKHCAPFSLSHSVVKKNE